MNNSRNENEDKAQELIDVQSVALSSSAKSQSSFNSVRIFDNLPKSLRINAYLSLFCVFICRFILCIPYSILMDYFDNIGFEEETVGEIMTYASLGSIAGNFLVNWIVDFDFKLSFIYCFGMNTFTYLLFVYGAAQRSYWLLALSRLLLGLSIGKIPAVRYIYANLPKKLLNKYSFLVVANMLIAATVAPFMNLLVALLFPSTTVTESMLPINKYSGAYYVGAFFTLITVVLVAFYFENPKEMENSESEVKKEANIKVPLDPLFLGGILICLCCFESTIETYSLIFPYFNKKIPSDPLSENTVNALITLSNFAVFVFIMRFKRSIDRVPRAKALCFFSVCTVFNAFLMTSWISQNIWLYYVLYVFQLIMIYCFISMISGTVGEMLSMVENTALVNAGLLTNLTGGIGRLLGALLFKMKDVLGSSERLINFVAILTVSFALVTFLVSACYYRRINKLK